MEENLNEESDDEEEISLPKAMEMIEKFEVCSHPVVSNNGQSIPNAL